MKYAIYKLTKVVGKKEYIPTPITRPYSSLSQSIKALEDMYEDEFNDDEMESGGGRCYFSKTLDEVVTYSLEENMIYLGSYTEDGEIKGLWRDSPVYLVDEFPCPYVAYKPRRKRGGDWNYFKLYMEGIEQQV